MGLEVLLRADLDHVSRDLNLLLPSLLTDPLCQVDVEFLMSDGSSTTRETLRMLPIRSPSKFANSVVPQTDDLLDLHLHL